MSRMAIFIDGGYLDKIRTREFAGQRVDFRKLSDLVSGEVEHLRTYFYDCYPYRDEPATDEQAEKYTAKRQFFSYLDRQDRHEVRTGLLRPRYDDNRNRIGFVQKGVDVLLAIDLVQLAAKHLITHATLFTADTDFVPAVQVAKREGVLVRLYHSSQVGESGALWRAVDERRVIDRDFMRAVRAR